MSAQRVGRGERLYRILRVLLRPVLRLLYRARAEGLGNVPAEGPVIIAANHVSMADSFFLPLFLPRRVTFLAKAQFFESALSGWALRALGMIPVRNDTPERTEATLNAGLQVLEAGGALALYPEGVISHDGRLYRGRTGVARLVLRSGAPVVPAGIDGTRRLLPRGSRVPRAWGRVTVRFGEPMVFEPEAGRAEDRFALRTITDAIMFEIMSLSGQEYAGEYAARRAGEPASENASIPLDERGG